MLSLLERNGHSVRLASSGVEAVALLAQDAADMLVLCGDGSFRDLQSTVAWVRTNRPDYPVILYDEGQSTSSEPGCTRLGLPVCRSRQSLLRETARVEPGRWIGIRRRVKRFWRRLWTKV